MTGLQHTLSCDLRGQKNDFQNAQRCTMAGFSKSCPKLLGITVAPVFAYVDTNQLFGFDCGNELVSKYEFD